MIDYVNCIYYVNCIDYVNCIYYVYSNRSSISEPKISLNASIICSI